MRVLAAVDGSMGSAVAAQYGALLASASGGRLVLLHALEDLPPQQAHLTLGDLAPERRQAAESILTLVQNRIGTSGATAQRCIRSGDAADAILTEAREGGYDLVTLGSRGVGGSALARLLVGSVALRVLAGEPPPTLLVPDAIADASHRPEVRSLLVPTDGSRASFGAAETAAEVARITNARVLLLHCEEPLPPEGFAALALSDEDRQRLAEGQERLGRLVLHATQEPFLRQGLAADVMETRGSPALTILTVARESGASLVVMGSYGAGESWLKRQRLGSVTEAVLADAPCPVVVCKRPLP